MSFSKWLKGATRIRFDDRTLGNLTKNAGVVGGTIVGGPLGLAIGAGGGALGQAALGGNFGESLNAGLKGAANTGLAQAGKGVLSHAIHSGPPALPGAPPTPAGGIPVSADANLTGAHIPTGADFGYTKPPGLLSKALNTGKGIAEFAGDHDKLSANLLTGIGDALDQTPERLAKAQAQLLERQASEGEYDYNQRKARDLALEPLRQALYGNLIQRLGPTGGA